MTKNSSNKAGKERINTEQENDGQLADLPETTGAAERDARVKGGSISGQGAGDPIPTEEIPFNVKKSQPR